MGCELGSSPLWILSPRATSPELTTLMVGSGFQSQPGGVPNDVLMHINMLDPANLLQQEAVGILGVNLIYAAFHELQTKESFLESVAQDVVKERIEIDYIDFRGPAFETWDSRTLLDYLVSAGFAEAVFFPSKSPATPPTEALYKKAVALAPDYFGHVDAAHAQVHARLLASAIQELRNELGETQSAPAGFFCLTAAPSAPNEAPPDIPGLLRRIDALLATGGDVLLFRQRELYQMTAFVNRYTTAPVRFVVGLSLIIREFENPPGNLKGNRLEALARLLAQNVCMYAYPMTAADVREWLNTASASGWEWSETNGWVSAGQLRRAPPLGHLFAYLLASNFIVPTQVPAALEQTHHGHV